MYFYLGNCFVRVLRYFIRPDEKLILFVSFGGRKYDDSPKAIYLQMINDKRFEDYRFVWAFINPKQFQIPIGDKIKTDTLKYFVTALKARVWITNSSVERGLDFKGKHTFYLNTWHGTPLKKMGGDICQNTKGFINKAKSKWDVFLTQGEFESKIFEHAFHLDPSVIKALGLPRNDIFASYSNSDVYALKKKLNIPLDKKVLFYAPTFREYEIVDGLKGNVANNINVQEWKSKLGNEYILLFRAHYEVAGILSLSNDDFLIDVSYYPSIEELMIVSDVLISDYSSIFFDFSIMHKPMLCYAYDYERYQNERGMYFDVRECLPTATNEKDLLELISNMEYDSFVEQTVRFQEKYVTVYGNATRLSLDIINGNLHEK